MWVSHLPENPEMPISESQRERILQATFPFDNDYIRMSDCMGDFNTLTDSVFGLIQTFLCVIFIINF